MTPFHKPCTPTGLYGGWTQEPSLRVWYADIPDVEQDERPKKRVRISHYEVLEDAEVIDLTSD
jgi:hypothetical protein